MTVQEFIRELEQEAGPNGSQKEIEFKASWNELDPEDIDLDAVRSTHPKKVTIWLS